MNRRYIVSFLLSAYVFLPASAQVAIRGKRIYTVSGPVLEDGVVLLEGGKIQAVGRYGEISIPSGFDRLEAEVVTPGLIDAHSVVGFSGYLNQPHDQDQVEPSSAIQPQLRAVDAYNPSDRLVEWIRSFGVTTVHTGHGPGKLISGQTLITKTVGRTVDEAVITPFFCVAASLGSNSLETGKAPGTRSKGVAMLRAELLQAQDYAGKRSLTDGEKRPPRDLAKETLAAILNREVPLMISVDRANDILTALRIASEFGIRVILEGAAEAHLVLDEIRASGFPVIVHPTMQRAFGERENLSFETARKLHEAGIAFAFQSGFEDYVPKTRVLLFEAAVAAGYGLPFEVALEAATLQPARILDIDSRVGSLEPGKDGDLVLFDGDPFEYTTHVVAVLIDGKVVSRGDSEWR